MTEATPEAQEVARKMYGRLWCATSNKVAKGHDCRVLAQALADYGTREYARGVEDGKRQADEEDDPYATFDDGYRSGPEETNDAD